MPSVRFSESGGRGAAAAALLALALAVAGTGCGKREGSPSHGALPESPGMQQGSGAAAGGQGDAAPSTARGFAVFVNPSIPSRITPPSVSVKSPPGQGAEILGTRWFVNGVEQESGRPLEPARFGRGDRIKAVVRLRSGAGEIFLTTPEVVASNALPHVADVRIEPRAPTAGSTVHAIVEARDPDGDPLKFKYGWHVDGQPVPGDGDSMILKGIRKGSWIHVAVTPNDGFADGAWKESPRYQVVNAPPVVRSQPPATIPPSRILTHEIAAEDPDGDPLTYALVRGPEGCTLSGATLTWQVSDADLGRTAEIVIRISDDDGASTVLTMNLNPQKP